MSAAKVLTWALMPILCWTMGTLSCRAQHQTFTQFLLSAQQANPSLLALEQQMAVSGNYRYQSSAGGITYKSVLLNAWMPIMAFRKGGPTATLGLLALDDRTTTGGLSFQTFGSTFAYGISLNKDQRLSFGLMGSYARRRIHNPDATTSSQYDPERGFDPMLPTGEVLTNLQSHYFGWNTGISWQKTDRWKQTVGYAGLAFYNLNEPNESFYTTDVPVAATVKAHIGYTAFEKQQWKIIPEVIALKTASQYQLQLGSLFRYTLDYARPQEGALQLGGRYRIGRGLSFSGQLEKPGFVAGLSYDLASALNEGPTASQHVVEVGFKIYRWVEGSNRKKKKNNNMDKPAKIKKAKPRDLSKNDSSDKESQDQEAIVVNEISMDLPKIEKKKWQHIPHQEKLPPTLSQRVKPLNIPRGSIEVGLNSRQFYFATNSTKLNYQAMQYLMELAAYLQDHPDLQLRIVGHTDNTGSAAYNLMLSRRRAAVAKDYLVSLGIDSQRITSEGKGMQEPLMPNTSAESRSANRRVDFVIHH